MEFIKKFFKQQKKSLIFVFLLALASSAYVYYDHKTAPHFLFSSIIYLPFIWISFGLTLLYILILQILEVKQKFVMIFLPFYFLAGIWGSMYTVFVIQGTKDTSQRTLQMSEVSNNCLKNYKNQENLYKISDITAKPIYIKTKVTGFTLGFVLSSTEDQYLNVIPRIVINDRQAFYGDTDYNNLIKLKKDVPQKVFMVLDKAHPYDINIIHQTKGTVGAYMKISIIDWSRQKSDIVFLPERPYPDQLCEINLANRRERPIFVLPELKLENYNSEDF